MGRSSSSGGRSLSPPDPCLGGNLHRTSAMTREMRFQVSRAERVGRVWRHYGAAALAVVATMGLLGSVPSLAIGIGTPQLILFLSVLVAAWYGGFGPGI